MKKIDLVLRTIGERTSDLALEFAIKQIQPSQIHIIKNVKPFALAVKKMLALDYQCDYVVFMDADCLILEDMSGFLQRNNLPYVDCYVLDKFRGHIHCGVHITRIDLVEGMRQIDVEPYDYKYVLRPESRTRGLALEKLKLGKSFKQFKIYHDFFQYYHHIFAKCALRELRSRQVYHRDQLDVFREIWIQQKHDLDFFIAQYAIDYARKQIPDGTSAQIIYQFIKNLPEIASQELSRLNISEKSPLSLEEVKTTTIYYQTTLRSQKMKVFGIGLSRTGTKSLTMALNMLGINVIHYPDNDTILQELITGNYNFSILHDYDGITDITVAPFYAQLDQIFPNSKFILTVRDKESWLKSLESHWAHRPAFNGRENTTKMQVRRLLRAAVYGTYSFNRERMSYVYDLHYKNVLDYFKDRPESLLVINICQGEGWEKLCPFFNLSQLEEPFPWMKKKSMLTSVIHPS